ncbi:putative hemolysin [Vibrio japonicus]|uniref:DUF333 domain-containing protein n=1 Tax=Vibrio japonicus TaxID=1824638 RepID=A0ABY5LNR1_9VIBR|nr:DUF333 domain-containing protein [Vibrio japonicus]UUM32727.1 DUF333 domain-containing protein [Vibrio japonicus]
MKIAPCFFTLAGTMLLAGCATTLEDYKEKEYTSVTSPASIYCVQQNGELNTVTEQGHRVTYCVRPNSKPVEQWEFYRSNHTQSDTK